MKRLTFTILISIILFTTIFSGCWNYSDVEEQFVVMGIAIDYDEKEKEYMLYAEVSRAKGGAEAETITRLESSKGTTLFEANRNLITRIGAKVYWGHTMVYIISERVAKKGITDVVGILNKLTQVRTDIFIIVCDNDSIDNIFEFEDPIHENVAQHLADLMKNFESSGKYRKAPLFKINQELASDEISLILPCITMEEVEKDDSDKEEGSGKDSVQKDEKPNKIIVTDGSCVFKKGKMVGKLNEEESLDALIVKKEVTKGYSLTVEEDMGVPNSSIEVINSNVKVNSTIDSKDNLILRIEIEIDADLVEIQSEDEYLKTEVREKIEKRFEKMLEEEIGKTIKKNQDEFKCDIFAFAGYVHRQQKEYWKANSNIWEDIYTDVQVSIKADVKIKSSALTFQPLKVGG